MSLGHLSCFRGSLSHDICSQVDCVLQSWGNLERRGQKWVDAKENRMCTRCPDSNNLTIGNMNDRNYYIARDLLMTTEVCHTL